MKNTGFQKERRSHTVLTVVFVIIAVAYLYPIFIVLVNSLKSNAAINLDTFAFPASDTFMGLQNYIKGMTFGNYPFWKSAFYSVFITVVSSALILLCTSMAAWYIARVNSKLCRVIYYLCVFSMVVPFQMVMFTLSKTADRVKIPYFNFLSGVFDKVALNTPWTIPIIYLGFGAGLAIFMFVGFVKSIPLEIEEAAAIDGCSPLRTYFSDALYDQNLEDAIMDSLLDNAAFKDLPSEVPGYYACMFLNYYYQLASYYSTDLNTLAQAQGYTDANAMLGASDTVITHLAKQDLLYQAIAETQGIQPTQEQLDAAAASYSGSSYGDNFIHQTALQTAVMEWLKTNAVIS